MAENTEAVEEMAAAVAEEQTTDGTVHTEGDWNEQAVVEASVDNSNNDLVSVDEAKAIFAENPGVACVMTTEGRLWREGYFA